MKRLEHEPAKPVVTINRADFQEDWTRGFCVLEFMPEREEILKDRRCPNKVFRRILPPIMMFRCMKCQFDCTDGPYLPDEQGKERTGRDMIALHISAGLHPWHYGPFQNPYGHVSECVIEGIESTYHEEVVKLCP